MGPLAICPLTLSHSLPSPAGMPSPLFCLLLSISRLSVLSLSLPTAGSYTRGSPAFSSAEPHFLPRLLGASWALTPSHCPLATSTWELPPSLRLDQAQRPQAPPPSSGPEPPPYPPGRNAAAAPVSHTQTPSPSSCPSSSLSAETSWLEPPGPGPATSLPPKTLALPVPHGIPSRPLGLARPLEAGLRTGGVEGGLGNGPQLTPLGAPATRKWPWKRKLPGPWQEAVSRGPGWHSPLWPCSALGEQEAVQLLNPLPVRASLQPQGLGWGRQLTFTSSTGRRDSPHWSGGGEVRAPGWGGGARGVSRCLTPAETRIGGFRGGGWGPA